MQFCPSDASVAAPSDAPMRTTKTALETETPDASADASLNPVDTPDSASAAASLKPADAPGSASATGPLLGKMAISPSSELRFR